MAPTPTLQQPFVSLPLAVHLVNQPFVDPDVYPDVVYPFRGKKRQSVPDVASRRIGQDKAYLTVREELSEPSTAADGVLWRERSDFVRRGYATSRFTRLD